MTTEQAAPAEVVKAAPVEAPKAAPAAESTTTAKPSAEQVKEGDGAIDPNKSYTQADLDRIVAKVKKNERYRTKKEVEAFYQGRESVAPAKPAEPAAPAAEDKPPVRDQFGSYEEFLDAKAAFTRLSCESSASLVMSQNIMPPRPMSSAHCAFWAIDVGVSNELKSPFDALKT